MEKKFSKSILFYTPNFVGVVFNAQCFALRVMDPLSHLTCASLGCRVGHLRWRVRRVCPIGRITARVLWRWLACRIAGCGWWIPPTRGVVEGAVGRRVAWWSSTLLRRVWSRVWCWLLRVPWPRSCVWRVWGLASLSGLWHAWHRHGACNMANKHVTYIYKCSYLKQTDSQRERERERLSKLLVFNTRTAGSRQ